MSDNVIIDIRNLYFRYKSSKNYNLLNVNLKIKKGEFILLIGPTGCGKTTLCRCINGLIPHFYAGDMEGTVYIDGLDTHKVPPNKLATKIGTVFQNPENMLFALNVERELAFGLENFAISPIEIRKRIKKISKLFSLEQILKKPPYELSGGEQQKVAIASVFILNPKILILDEPTANLDPYTAERVLALLYDLHKKYGTTIIIIEHRIEMVLPYITRIIAMDKGQIVFDGPPEDVLETTILEDLGVQVPRVTLLVKKIKQYFPKIKIKAIPKTVKEAVSILGDII